MNQVSIIAKEIAKLGRGGDTMLAHITPHEAMVLRAMGGAGTINPYTGLPEYRFRLRRIIRAIVPVALVVIAVVQPQLIPAIGSSILEAAGAVAAGTTSSVMAGTTAATVGMQAAGAAAISATTTALTGGNLEQVAMSAATAAVGAGVAGNVGQAVNTTLVNAGVPAAVANVAASTTGAAASAAATGRDVNEAMTAAAITSSATTAYRELTRPAPPTLTQQPSPPSTPAGAEGPTDYSITAGMTFPGQGLRAPELAPLPPAEQIGVTPINYSNIIAPSRPSIGFQQPRLRELPPAETIGREPIDYREILTPEQRNLPEMGGGTGLTARAQDGTLVQVAPQEGSETLRRAGEQAVRALASDFASDLNRRNRQTGTSDLASTGLFQPVSVVPTETTGIAPIARGKPILGGEDEEATGTWGTKTLRG